MSWKKDWRGEGGGAGVGIGEQGWACIGMVTHTLGSSPPVICSSVRLCCKRYFVTFVAKTKTSNIIKNKFNTEFMY
jgi:hypothetical protein